MTSHPTLLPCYWRAVLSGCRQGRLISKYTFSSERPASRRLRASKPLPLLARAFAPFSDTVLIRRAPREMVGSERTAVGDTLDAALRGVRLALHGASTNGA